ncbi:hypothetical protein QBC43DRAFT_325076 [Cladorrhinum sp. PSN259]|nr:hypothetical protein QBC43DRAFT_325076 [Cladorrhinum sp. PSN259]
MKRPGSWLTFTYSISREYPYRWFPWVTLIGGLVFATLFTVFSLAAKGYYLEVIYTRNPNITEAQLYWFSRAPFSWTDPLSPACQPTELQIGTQVFTDKLWRSFTIITVAVADEEQSKPDLLEPVIVYKNNPLENCTVDNIVVYLRNETTITQQYEIASSHFLDRVDARADISCRVATKPPATIRMTTTLGARPATWLSTFGVITNFSMVSEAQLERSNAVLGELLIAPYDYLLKRRQLKQQLASINSTNTTAAPNVGFLDPAIYVLSRNKTSQPISSPTFFTGFRLTPRTGSPSTAPTVTQDQTMTPLIYPQIMPPDPITRIAKVFYSILLSDLGQDHKVDTVVSDRDLLIEYTDTLIKDMEEEPGIDWKVINFWKNGTSHMKPGNESTIYTQYTCQVPRQRVTGSVVIAVMVSDIVLLQALWTLFTWGTMWWMQRTRGKKDSDIMCCVGCAYDNKSGGGGMGRSLTGFTITEVVGGSGGSSSDEEKRVGGYRS